MKKLLISCTCLFLTSLAQSQKGDELLVYAVKGQVTALYKKQESRVKIGKVLKAGTILKSARNASLTMICNEGKTLQLNRAGTFPLSRWRDSCRSGNASVTSNYFKYVWQQLYVYSPEAREAKSRRHSELAVSRNEPPDPKGIANKFTRLEFEPQLDTVYYDGESFPLSWTGNGYRGQYHFTLYDEKGLDTLYTDSLRFSYISIDRFKQHLQPGTVYTWTVRAEGVPVSEKRWLIFVSQAERENLEKSMLESGTLSEDSATQRFRVAYLLEQQHYFAAAYRWYEEAARLDSERLLFRDQLIRFRNKFWIR